MAVVLISRTLFHDGFLGPCHFIQEHKFLHKKALENCPKLLRRNIRKQRKPLATRNKSTHEVCSLFILDIKLSNKLITFSIKNRLGLKKLR